MKRLLPLLLLVACGPNEPADQDLTLYYGTLDQAQLEVYIVDSCEYVGMRAGYAYGLFTHKGNCRFCAARAVAREGADVPKCPNAHP